MTTPMEDPVLWIFVAVLVIFFFLAERSRAKEIRTQKAALRHIARAREKDYWQEWAEVHEEA